MAEAETLAIETRDNATSGGKPAVYFLLDLPLLNMVAYARTSLRLFQVAAHAIQGKYGDTVGAVVAKIPASGPGEITVAVETTCPACQRHTAGSFAFCPYCGAKLPPEELPIEALQPRRFRSVTADQADQIPGWLVVLECGHEAWFAIKPITVDSIICSECMNDFLKRHRAQGAQGSI